MSENNLWISFWLLLATVILGVTYALYEGSVQSNKANIELQTNCVSNGGSVIIGRNGDQQCIRFAK